MGHTRADIRRPQSHGLATAATGMGHPGFKQAPLKPKEGLMGQPPLRWINTNASRSAGHIPAGCGRGLSMRDVQEEFAPDSRPVPPSAERSSEGSESGKVRASLFWWLSKQGTPRSPVSRGEPPHKIRKVSLGRLDPESDIGIYAIPEGPPLGNVPPRCWS